MPSSAYRVAMRGSRKEPEHRTELGRLLIEGRKKRGGWTQAEASEKSGVPLRTLQRWETEPEVQPDAVLLISLLDALDVPRAVGFRALDWLQGPDDDADPDALVKRLRRMSPRQRGQIAAIILNDLIEQADDDEE